MSHLRRAFSALLPLAIASATLMAPAPASAAINLPFHVEYQASYPANLYWFLNALAGDRQVQVDAYRALWKRAVPADKRDGDFLKRFAGLRSEYSGALREEDTPENGMVPTPPSAGVDVATKFSALFLSSATLDEVWPKAEILLTEDDQQELHDIVAHFEPRFERLWKQEGYLNAYRSAFQRYADTLGLDQELDSVRRFYGVPDGRPMHMRVQFVFAPGKGETFARTIGTNLVVEVPAGDAPSDRIDIVAHEISHYFYGRAGIESSPAYLKALFGTGDSMAAPAYGLLNEGLATAIQAIVLEIATPAKFLHTFKTPNGLYNDRAIDTYAKALFPLVKTAIAKHETLTQIAPQCVTTYRQAFAGAPLAPSNYLQTYLLCARDPHGAALDAYFKALPPRSLWSYSLSDVNDLANDMRRYAAVSCVVAVTRADWPTLATLRDTLGLLPKAPPSKPGVLTIKRPVNGYVFVVYGADETALSQVLAQFAQSKTLEVGWHPY